MRPFRALAAAAAALLLMACGERRPRGVLWVTFDTTRADFLGCYGKASARTPNLDRLAAEGTLFQGAVTAVPITLPSHSTMCTGTYPILHGVRDNSFFRLPESRTTLAEVLRSRGFATGAAIGGFPLVRSSGIAQGFDFFDDHVTIGIEDYKGDRVPGPASARVYAWSTLGSATGAVVAGLWLLPSLRFAGVAAAASATSLAIAALAALGRRPRLWRWAAVAGGGLVAIPWVASRTPWHVLGSSVLTSVANADLAEDPLGAR